MNKNWFLYLLIIFGIYLFFALNIFNWVIDDLYIYFRYVNNFVSGNGISYNSGEYVEGFSSFSWFLILSVFKVLNLPLEFSSKVASLTFSFLIALYVFKICIAQNLRRFSYLACVMTLFNLPFILWSISGFEIMFYIFLILLCIYKLINLKTDTGEGIILSALTFLISITRPEGVLFSIAILSYLFITCRSKSFSIRTIVIYLILFIGFLLFRFVYFGDLLQNTYYAKIGHNIFGYYELRTYKNGVFYILDFFRHNIHFLLLFLTLPLVYGKLKSNNFFLFIILLVALQFLFVIFAGGDWMGQYRFIIPAIPLLSIATVISIHEVVVKYGFAKLRHSLLAMIILILILLNLTLADYTVINKEIVLWNNVKKISEDIRRQIPEKDLTAIGSSGIIPYALEKNTFIDMVGLTDKFIAKHGRRHGTWFERSLPEYVYGKNPEWLIMWKKKNNSGIYNFRNANPVYFDMALDSSFNKYSLHKSYDVYDEDRIELYRFNKN